MRTTEPEGTTDTKLERIAWLSVRDAGKRLDGLMHLFNKEFLPACFHRLDGKKAMGADGDMQARERFYQEPIARIGHDGFSMGSG